MAISFGINERLLSLLLFSKRVSSRLPYRILLFVLPFPSIALLSMGGFGLQFVHVALILAVGNLVWLIVKDKTVRLTNWIAVFSVGLLILILVGFFRIILADTIPYIPPPYPSEAGQVLYWISVTGYLVVANVYTMRASKFRVLYRDWTWFAAGTAVLLLIGAYEFASPYLSMPFPYEIIYSNPSFAHNWTSEIAGINRFTGTFPEPSMFALYGSVALGVIFGLQRWFLLAATASALVLSFSTSAMIGMGVFVLGLLVFGGDLTRKRLQKLTLVLGVLGAIVIVLFPSIRTALYETTIGKLNSHSVHARYAMLIEGLRAWMASPLLGWGLGSARTLDGLTMLLVNFGIIGTLWTLGFFAQTLRIPGQYALNRGLHIALFAGVAVHIVSNPDWTFPFIWVVAGAVWALHSQGIYKSTHEARC